MEKPACCRPSMVPNTWKNQKSGAKLGGHAPFSAEDLAIECAAFNGTQTFVGTASPYHRDDGEGPRRKARLSAFALETFPVTNARFASFVKATGYVTLAETFGWAAVFRMGQMPDSANGWQAVRGACWSSPEGAGSSIDERMDHPVVQVSLADAAAFAAWARGRLPSEAEWEHAARGGLDNPRFPWGDEEPDDERILCNIWQGSFPEVNTAFDGYLSTNPPGAFPANGAGLFDMVGNVWEWSADPFRLHSATVAAKRRDIAAMAGKEGLLKGGSFLCHRSYCYRYRIAARMALDADSCGNNVGFRIAYDR